MPSSSPTIPDADTLDTLRPGETDLATTIAVNRAVAAEMAAEGVEIFVQIADRGAFRRWMQDRENTPEIRRGWVDRGRVLRGAAAHKLLGIAPPVAPPRPTYGKPPGPIADRLLALLEADDGEAIDALTQGLLEAGRSDVLDLAIRKIGQRHGDDAAEELEGDLLAAAERGRTRPLRLGRAGGAARGAAAAADAGRARRWARAWSAPASWPDTVEVRFLPGWRSPEALEALSPGALRRVLLDLLAGAEPRDLPPGDTDDLARRGFGLLLGLQIDWAIPTWETIAAADGLPGGAEEAEEEDSETPEEARRSALFDGWRGAVFEASERLRAARPGAALRGRRRDRRLPGGSRRRIPRGSRRSANSSPSAGARPAARTWSAGPR